MNGTSLDDSSSVWSNGFTLVEIAAAVALLGFAFTALVGLQTSYADRAALDRNLTTAAFASQYLLTTIETAKALPDPGSKEESLANALNRVGYFEELAPTALSSEDFAGWTLSTNIESIDILDRKDAIRRVELKVRWGDSGRDEYAVTYFMRNATVPRAGRS